MLTKTFRSLAFVGAACAVLPASADDSTYPHTPPLRNISFSYSDNEPAQPAPVVAAPAAEAHVDVTAQPIPQQPIAEAAAPCEACNACQQTVCDCKTVKALKKRAAKAHKPLFYANDFSYLCDPCYSGDLLGDNLKNLGGSRVQFDVGGQYRARWHSEHNHRGLGLTGESDDFLLHRTRLYLDAQLSPNIRFFGEVLDANSNFESNNPRPIEENRWDAQNLFIDAVLWNDGDRKLTARGGRQEIALGAQRYVSPLDWANTRRTFDGGRLMYQHGNWSLDGFWLAPLVRDVNSFDEANEDVSLYGIYSSYKTSKTNTLDVYWIAFDNDLAGYRFDSVGARYNGKVGGLLVDTEAAYQFGDNADNSSHDAGFFTFGLGKVLSNSCKKPTTWLYLDWASGDDQLAAGNGHHHYQPLAHKYNGFMDLFGRRNLIDLNWLTTVQLSEKVKLLTWYHSFWLENDNDTPYSVVMTPFAPGVTPTDSHLGHELDLLLSVGLTPRSNLTLGYSHFWSGDYFDSPGVPTNDNANFFYSQFTVNF